MWRCPQETAAFRPTAMDKPLSLHLPRRFFFFFLNKVQLPSAVVWSAGQSHAAEYCKPARRKGSRLVRLKNECILERALCLPQLLPPASSSSLPLSPALFPHLPPGAAHRFPLLRGLPQPPCPTSPGGPSGL